MKVARPRSIAWVRRATMAVTGTSGQTQVHRSRRSEWAARWSLPVHVHPKANMTVVFIPVRMRWACSSSRDWVQTGPAPVADVCADRPDDGDDENYPWSRSADIQHVVPESSHESCKHAVTEQHQGSALCSAISPKAKDEIEKLAETGNDH